MDRSCTPLPSEQQVKSSVDNLNRDLKSTDTLTNDYNISLKERMNSNNIKIKELNSFIDTFSRENVNAANNERKLREHNCRLRSSSIAKDSYMTVQKALALGKQIDLQNKEAQQIRLAYERESILRKPISANNDEMDSPFFASLPIPQKVNQKNNTNSLKFHDNGSAIVKITISDRFTWNKTTQFMYTSIEKNPELIHNLADHQLDFLQECFEKVYLCSAEMYSRETYSDSSSDKSDTDDKEETLNVDSVADIIFNDNIYDDQDDIIDCADLQLSISTPLLELEKSLENICQSDDENYSSYLDFEEFSTSPKNILMTISNISNDDFIEEKPFIEQLFEKKLDNVQGNSDSIPKAVDDDSVRLQKRESLDLTPTQSHIKSEKTHHQNSKNVLDQMIGVKSSHSSGNFVDDLF